MPTKKTETTQTKEKNRRSNDKGTATGPSLAGKFPELAGNWIKGAELQNLNPRDILAVQHRIGNQAAISITNPVSIPGIQRLVSAKDFSKSTRLSFGRKGKSGDFFNTVTSELKGYEGLVSNKADDATKKVKLHAILNLLNGWIETEGETSSRVDNILSLKSEIGSELSKNTAVTSDEIILTADPNLAKKTNIDPYLKLVKKIITGWGLPFSSKMVLLENLALGKEVKPAIALVWDSAWGDKPATKEMPSNLSPIDASAAINAVHAVPGWAKLAKEYKGILDATLSGETSDLSQKVRNYLKNYMTALKGAGENDQKEFLKSIVTAKDAVPDVVNETVKSPKAEFTMEPAVEVKNYAFQGKTADAEKTIVKFKDGAIVPILSPKAPTPGFHNHTVVETADAAAYLPKEVRKLITEVVLGPVTNPDDPYWATKYKTPDFHSYMTSGVAGVVTIYPDKTAKPSPDANYQRGTLMHETGHTWSYKNWGVDTSKDKWLVWKAAMNKDKIAPSGYAMNSIGEDVAEAIQVYASTKGSPAFEEYKKMMPNRFKILTAEYDK